MFIEAGDVTHRRRGQNRNEEFRDFFQVFCTEFFLTQISLFWHNSPRNDENKIFRENQNFDPPNFWSPLIFVYFERLCYTAPLYQIWWNLVKGCRS